MLSIDDEYYLKEETVQMPVMATFLEHARESLKQTPRNFYVSDRTYEIDTHSPPYNVLSVLASGYKEIGLWIPSNLNQSPYSAIVLAWADEDYPTPSTIQLVYVSKTGHLILEARPIAYDRIKGRPVTDALTEDLI